MSFKSLTDGAKKSSPELLIGGGIVGFWVAGYLAVKATPKYEALKDELIENSENPDDISVKETLKVAAKCYWKPATLALISTACIISADRIHLKRATIIGSAFTITKAAYDEYKDKVVEVIGKEKEQEVEKKVAETKLKKDPVENKEVIVIGGGTTLCYDSISQRYFKSDAATLKQAANVLCDRLRSEMYVSLNDFYYEIGLEPLRIIGEDLGWNIDDGYLDIWFSSMIATDGTPCLVLNYNVAPRYDYRKLM